MLGNMKDMQNLGLASLGAVLEYFDFQVYVFVAASLSVALFPPGASIWKNQVEAFGIFAIGYLVRPIAGITIAHYADRLGRKKLFIFTVLLMSVPTFLMGLLPTYAVAGWMAPVALLVLRVLQGCAVGGEVPGASVFVSEHAKPEQLGLSSGIFVGMVNCGLLLGAAAAAFSKHISNLDPSLVSLAWRLPFLMGGVFGLMSAYLRRHLGETPLFEQIRKEKKISARVPVMTVIIHYRGQCAFALALMFVFATTTGIYFQYMPTYLISGMHFPAKVVLTANVFGIAAFVLGMPIWGVLRDRFGWTKLLATAGLFNIGSSIWFFNYLPTLAIADDRLIYAYVLVGFLGGITHSLLAGLLSALFPTPIRQSGFALPFSIGTAIFSGLTPLIIAWLVRGYGLAAPMFQTILGGTIALILAVSVRFLPLYLGGVAVEFKPVHPDARSDCHGKN